MVKINYESDFSLKEVIKNDRFRVPFVFTYMVGKTSYVASWDGESTVNCKVNEDGSVTVIFDKHGLEVGKLKVRREFFIPDENFPDGVCNMVSVDNTDIILVEGATEGTEVEDVFTPPYVSGGGGEIVAVEIVDNLESEAADKALSANMGRALKGMIPTKVSELENDEGYITEIPEDYATKEDVGDAVSTVAGGLSKDISNKADKTTVEAIQKKELGLSVLDNGNIVLSNANGESKEFMPATPSGDPMHWAYVSAGAEYNDSGNFIVKDAPWKDLVDPIDYKAQWNLDIVDASLVQTDSIVYNGKSCRYAKDIRTSPVDNSSQPRYHVVIQSGDKWVWDDTVVLHLPNHWYLNGLGDLTNGEMREIYLTRYALKSGLQLKQYFRWSTARTNLNAFLSTSDSQEYNRYAQSASCECLTLGTMRRSLANNISNAFEESKSRHIIDQIDGRYLKTASSVNEAYKRAQNLVTSKHSQLNVSLSYQDSPPPLQNLHPLHYQQLFSHFCNHHHPTRRCIRKIT